MPPNADLTIEAGRESIQMISRGTLDLPAFKRAVHVIHEYSNSFRAISFEMAVTPQPYFREIQSFSQPR